MGLLILMPKRDTEALVGHLKHLEPTLSVAVWPQVPDPEAILFAVTWNHPPGALTAYPNLKAACSYGAGIDHFLSDPQLPQDLAVGRVVTNQLVRDMTRYLLAAALERQKNLALYRHQQQTRCWRQLPEPEGEQVCILGLGALGRPAAERFASLGYQVRGWSYSPKNIENVTCYSGGDLDKAVSGADILICLLPLNHQTRGILNLELFQKTGKGCFLINAARGGHLNQADLITALDSGVLSGACLDVCDPEPLPKDHPFWAHPAITLTPHIAAVTNAAEVAEHLLESYRRVCAGGLPLDQVSLLPRQ